MMRPVFLDYPEIFAPNSGGFDHLDTEFLLGPSLLVAPPPFAETLDDYSVSFPKDSRVVRLLDWTQSAAFPASASDRGEPSLPR